MTPHKHPMHIVVADDDHDDQLLVKQAIEDCLTDNDTTSVYNGSQLLNLLCENHSRKGDALPDVILLDINMPQVNGFTALREIRKDPRLQHIPVYILTTSNSVFDRETAMRLGATGFYTKPIHFHELKAIISEVTGAVN